MQEEVETQQVTLHDYLRILYRGRWIITLAFIAVVGSTLYFTMRATPVYEAATTIMIDTGKTRAGLELFTVTGVGQRETIINNQVEILKSRTLAEAVVNELRAKGYGKRFHLFGTKKDKNGINAENLPDEVVVKNLSSSMKISPRRNTDLIDIKVQAPDPKEAAIIANTIAQVYHRRSLSQSREEVREVKDFLQSQLAVKEKDLVQSELALKEFKEKEGVVALPEETKQWVEQLADFEAMYNEAQTALGVAQTRLDYLKSQYAEQVSVLDESMLRVSSPLLAELRSKLAELEATHARLIAMRYPDDHPKLLDLKRQIEVVKDKMREEVRNLVGGGLTVTNPMSYSQQLLEQIYTLTVDVEAYTTRAEAFRKIVDEYAAKLRKLPEKSLQLARLERLYKVNEKIYLMMKEKLEEAKIQEVSQIGNVYIVDPAKEPLHPIKPRKRLNMVLAALVGLGLGVGVTFVLEYMDTSLKTIEDVERQVGLPVLAWIPTIRPEEKRGRRLSRGRGSVSVEETLITHLSPKSPVSEAYRTLRTNIQFSSADKPLRSILVTSASPTEGKSTTIANLAMVMAQMGSRTLLVDTDLRRPILHSLFRQKREPGLTEVLMGSAEFEAVVRQTGIENLSLLTCGTLPPNPSELLGSERMRALIKEMGDRFDFMLFDTPPVIAVTDASVLAAELDGVIMVVWSGRTSREVVLRGRTLLNNVGARIIGSVLNNVDIERRYGAYAYPYHYYYYYYYYYTPEGEKKSRKHRA